MINSGIRLKFRRMIFRTYFEPDSVQIQTLHRLSRELEAAVVSGSVANLYVYI